MATFVARRMKWCVAVVVLTGVLVGTEPAGAAVAGTGAHPDWSPTPAALPADAGTRSLSSLPNSPP